MRIRQPRDHPWRVYFRRACPRQRLCDHAVATPPRVGALCLSHRRDARCSSTYLCSTTHLNALLPPRTTPGFTLPYSSSALRTGYGHLFCSRGGCFACRGRDAGLHCRSCRFPAHHAHGTAVATTTRAWKERYDRRCAFAALRRQKQRNLRATATRLNAVRRGWQNHSISFSY